MTKVLNQANIISHLIEMWNQLVRYCIAENYLLSNTKDVEISVSFLKKNSILSMSLVWRPNSRHTGGFVSDK